MQADLERVIRAAKREGAEVHFDMRTLVATVIPTIHSPEAVDHPHRGPRILPPGKLAPDGKENWDEN